MTPAELRTAMEVDMPYSIGYENPLTGEQWDCGEIATNEFEAIRAAKLSLAPNQRWCIDASTGAFMIMDDSSETYPRIIVHIRECDDSPDHPAVYIGDRIEAGEGEDYDTGIVERIDSTDTAFISWDSGVKTPYPINDLRVITDDPN